MVLCYCAQFSVAAVSAAATGVGVAWVYVCTSVVSLDDDCVHVGHVASYSCQACCPVAVMFIVIVGLL